MSESNYWNRIKPMLFGWDPVRVENAAGPGTPDVNHIHGWIELKDVKAWPKRETTPLRVPHFTPQQRAWLVRRVSRGGAAHVLMNVAGESLLLWGDIAATHLGNVPKEELIELAIGHWPKGSKDMRKELRNALQRPRIETDIR